jgi:hypothetical protein
MLLVVQHVATAEQDGINAYCHEHGTRVDWQWEPPPGVPDEDPGTVIERLTRVTVQGRGRVRSYLDVAAPDGAPVSMLSRVHDIVAAVLRSGGQFPLVVVSGPLFVRFEVEEALRYDWRAELRRLLDVCAELLAGVGSGKGDP